MHVLLVIGSVDPTHKDDERHDDALLAILDWLHLGRSGVHTVPHATVVTKYASQNRRVPHFLLFTLRSSSPATASRVSLSASPPIQTARCLPPQLACHVTSAAAKFPGFASGDLQSLRRQRTPPRADESSSRTSHSGLGGSAVCPPTGRPVVVASRRARDVPPTRATSQSSIVALRKYGRKRSEPRAAKATFRSSGVIKLR